MAGKEKYYAQKTTWSCYELYKIRTLKHLPNSDRQKLPKTGKPEKEGSSTSQRLQGYSKQHSTKPIYMLLLSKFYAVAWLPLDFDHDHDQDDGSHRKRCHEGVKHNERVSGGMITGILPSIAVALECLC